MRSLEAIYPIKSAGYVLPGQQNDGSFYDPTRSHKWNTTGQSLGLRQFMSFNNMAMDFTGRNVIDEIFSKKTKQESIDIIEQNSKLWTQMQSGSQGFSGKKTVNAMTMFDELFTVESEPEVDEVIEDSDDLMNEVLGE